MSTEPEPEIFKLLREMVFSPRSPPAPKPPDPRHAARARQRYLSKLSTAARAAKVKLTLDGVTKSRTEWALQAGISPETLRKRLKRGEELRHALDPYRRRPKTERTHSKEEIKNFLASKKDAPCTDCGVKYHLHAMEFDHVRGKKRFELSKSKDRQMAQVVAELAKCDLVCANCHRVRTAVRRAG